MKRSRLARLERQLAAPSRPSSFREEFERLRNLPSDELQRLHAEMIGAAEAEPDPEWSFERLRQLPYEELLRLHRATLGRGREKG
jgi:hypothetical protein